MFLPHNQMDVIPDYLYRRDILKEAADTEVMKTLKMKILEHPHVVKVLAEQLVDGSWGRFHSMNTSNQSNYTTEMALNRLLVLGLDYQDEPIRKVYDYMVSYMKDAIDLRDYKEKKHDWRLLTRLFVSTRLLIIDPTCDIALEEMRPWGEVVTAAFKGGSFDYDAYITAYNDILKPEAGKSYWSLENFYMVSALKHVLDDEMKKTFVYHMLNFEKGIYYIYDKKLSEMPGDFTTLSASRYMNAMKLILDYQVHHPLLDRFMDAVNGLLVSNDFDIDRRVKDGYSYPLSDNWRKSIRRQTDGYIKLYQLKAVYDESDEIQ